MTQNNKNALVMLGSILGAAVLTTITIAYHDHFAPGMSEDGQYGMVLLPTATGGGAAYGAALAMIFLDRPRKPSPQCLKLTLLGLSFSGFWVLSWPNSGVFFCLPALLVGFSLLAYLGSARFSTG